MVDNMVKDEIFGTRPTFLKKYLKESDKLIILPTIWVVTCVSGTNPDPKTRYLVFQECKSDDDFLKKEDTEIFKKFFKFPIYQIVMGENDVSIKNIYNDDVEKLSLSAFKDWIKDQTKCKCDSGVGATSRPGFSGFFRTNMGNHFSLIDVDFLLVKDNNIVFLIEEKTYANDDESYIGYGQYLSFQEIYNDIIMKIDDLFFFILFIKDEDYILKYDVMKNGLPKRKGKNIQYWGYMIPIDISEMQKTNIEELIKLFEGIK